MVSTGRTSDPLGVGTRIKIAPVEQFLTQVTLLLTCELVTTTRNKCYKGGDRSELAIAKSRAYEQERSLSVDILKTKMHLYGAFFVLKHIDFFNKID
ncbi:MAG: hypothetical protein E7019_06655 [Alphaproteobacteria bacterium]|nr:hypothetical protein [Alphaproteobacteria bacterium]